MDQLIDEDLTELRQLASMIIKTSGDPARLTEMEAKKESWDRGLWNELAQSGVTSVALPVEAGGMGYGLIAIAVVLREQGEFLTPLPLWTSMVAHRRLAEAGLDQFMSLLEKAAVGDVRTTLALEERAGADLRHPDNVVATAGPSGHALTGTKVAVPHHTTATHVLVSAKTDDGAKLFLIEADAHGVAWTGGASTSRSSVARLTLDNVSAQLVGDAEQLAALLREARLALAAVLVGVARGAVRLTSGYVSEREQFGRPIGSFQSLQHQLADSAIGIQAAELVLAQALVDEDDRSVQVASWWARSATEDTVYRCQHVHGGIGVDVDYPIHRYFLWGRELSLALGNSEQLLEELGELIVEEAS